MALLTTSLRRRSRPFVGGLVVLTWLALAGPGSAWADGFEGVLARRDGQVLASTNADRLFTPASVQKLVVSAALFHHLGPAHRISTPVFAAGALEGVEGDRVLRGDLVLRGAGDPTWNERFRDDDPVHPLQQLARDLARLGIVQVDGALVLDASALPGRRFPVDWSETDATLSWGASPSALAVDENLVTVTVSPGASVGAPARLSGADDVEWVNRTSTVSAARHGRGTLAFQPIWDESRVVLRGEYPISEPPFTVRVAAPDPVARAGRHLLRELEQQGIEVSRGVRIVEQPYRGELALLAQIQSPPVTDIVEVVLRDSRNFYAESLLRVLAHEKAPEGGRLDAGLDVLSEFLVEEVGLAEEEFELDDASGLSPSNLITPNAVVELLEWAWQQPWRSSFFDALATGNRGTLASWGSLPPIKAKTGTLRHTQTLAGILRAEDEDPIFFALMLNHRIDRRSQRRGEIVRQLWEWHRVPRAVTVPASGRED